MQRLHFYWRKSIPQASLSPHPGMRYFSILEVQYTDLRCILRNLRHKNITLERGFACSSNHIGVKSKLGETNLAPWPFPQTPLAQAHMAGPFVLWTFCSGLFDSKWNSDIQIICISKSFQIKLSEILTFLSEFSNTICGISDNFVRFWSEYEKSTWSG